jgi:hypothetical protein
MKNIILALLLVCGLSFADSMSNTSISVLGGYGYTQYYQGGTIGIRFEKPVHKFISFGAETVTGLSMKHTDADRDEDADYMRMNALFKLYTQFGIFEPYLIGSFGKGITAENIQNFPELSASGSGNSRANSAWGAGVYVGARLNFNKTFIGCEWGLSKNVLDYGHATVSIGLKL